MVQQKFSEEFKKSAVQKVLLRGSKPVKLICEELGVANPTLYEWKKQYANIEGMKKSQRRPQDWSAAEKLEAVIQFSCLPSEKQGEFLRSSGLHLEYVKGWKKAMEAGLGDGLKDSRSSRQELAQLKARTKELERELLRKDKALAETTALIVLKKKAELIWGTGNGENE